MQTDIGQCSELLKEISIPGAGGVQYWDVEFNVGDIVRLDYSVTSLNQLTVVTYDGTTNQNYFVNYGKAPSLTGSVEITITSAANQLKTYSMCGATTLTLTKILGIEQLGNTLMERAFIDKGAIEEYEQEIDILQEIVGDYYWTEDTRIDKFDIDATITYYNVSWLKGDVIRLDWSAAISGDFFTVVTYVDDANKDYFVNTRDNTSSGSVTITITADTTKLKIFSEVNPVDLIFYKRHSISGSGETLSERTARHDEEISTLAEAVDYRTVGEAMLMNNDEYNPKDFMRIVALDNNYKFFSVANIKRIIDQMAEVGLNYLELGFGGSGRGLCFKLNDMTVTAHGMTFDLTDCVITDFGQYLNEEDMEEIIEYAANNGIEIIPALNVLSHMDAILSVFKEFRYAYSTNSLNFKDPIACDFAIAVSDKYGKWFADHRCHFFNLCADEFTGGFSNLQSHNVWGYADFINRNAYVLAKHRFSLLCWNDPICVNEALQPYINRRLIVNYWSLSHNYADVDTLVSQGYRLINSNEWIYWVANANNNVTVERMRLFNINSFAGSQTYNHPVGAAFCIWTGNRENPKLNDGGTAITDEILPLIKAFGETIDGQINS